MLHPSCSLSLSSLSRVLCCGPQGLHMRATPDNGASCELHGNAMTARQRIFCRALHRPHLEVVPLWAAHLARTRARRRAVASGGRRPGDLKARESQVRPLLCCLRDKLLLLRPADHYARQQCATLGRDTNHDRSLVGLKAAIVQLLAQVT